MSACPNKLSLLHALADGELDAANSLSVEAHVKNCAGCAATIEQIDTVRARLTHGMDRYVAPTALRTRVDAMLDEATAAPKGTSRAAVTTSPRSGRWFAGGAVTALAASLALFLALPQLTATGIEDQLIASHVRSLLAAHLTDVATSDKHVVRPWFNGKIDFAPPVVDLAAQGFPLAGGRLDYLDGGVVPALVYHRRQHSINLFIRPVRGIGSTAAFNTTRNGYSLVHWTDDGLQYWAVSDIPAPELDQFRRQFLDQSKQVPMR